jgi:hypothetical protein
MADVEGRHPALPWQDTELGQVLTAVDRLAAALTPAPIEMTPVGLRLSRMFSGWRELAAAAGLHAPAPPPSRPAADGGGQGTGADQAVADAAETRQAAAARVTRLDPWSRAHLAALAELEATWPEHATGRTLLHGDLRADNLLVTADGVVMVDWPHASRGAAFVDLVLLAPSVAMQGGPGLAGLVSRTEAGRAAPPGALAAVLCAFAGYLTVQSLRPPPPGLPTVREFQAAQAAVARGWLRYLL